MSALILKQPDIITDYVNKVPDDIGYMIYKSYTTHHVLPYIARRAAQVTVSCMSEHMWPVAYKSHKRVLQVMYNIVTQLDLWSLVKKKKGNKISCSEEIYLQMMISDHDDLKKFQISKLDFDIFYNHIVAVANMTWPEYLLLVANVNRNPYIDCDWFCQTYCDCEWECICLDNLDVETIERDIYTHVEEYDTVIDETDDEEYTNNNYDYPE